MEMVTKGGFTICLTFFGHASSILLFLLVQNSDDFTINLKSGK